MRLLSIQSGHVGFHHLSFCVLDMLTVRRVEATLRELEAVIRDETGVRGEGSAVSSSPIQIAFGSTFIRPIVLPDRAPPPPTFRRCRRPTGSRGYG